MTTYAQYQAQGVAFLKAQLGKPYSEDPGQNFGPYSYDCQGLAFCCYRAAANLVTGPGIGLIGSRAQYELSTVKLTPADDWLVLDQCFFDGADPPFGHTGVYVGPVVPGGAPMMIDAYDKAEGVRYNEFDPDMTDGPGLVLRGRTRPLLLAPVTKPPGGGDMVLILAQGGAVGGIGANSYWIYSSSEDIGPYLWHVTSMDAVRINELVLPFKTITTHQASLLDAKLLNV